MGFNNIMQLEVHISFFICPWSIFIRVPDNCCFMIMIVYKRVIISLDESDQIPP
jgi:hypothetical protein